MRRQPTAPSGIGSAVRAWLGFGLLLVAHFAVRPLFTGPVAVDFALIALLFAAVRMRSGFAAVTGFLLGIALDALAPGSFGAATLVLTLLGFGASWLKAVFFADNLSLTALFLFGGKWLFDVAMTLLVGTKGGASMLVTLLLWSPLSAAATALVALLLLTLFRPLYRPAVT
ncbi:MAG: rod shape-determining protein MreD [Gemmatimonadaceae bacterium]|nr:rod shape-determining protein MreD [Gemmatimonadaceae bacterium]